MICPCGRRCLVRVRRRCAECQAQRRNRRRARRLEAQRIAARVYRWQLAQFQAARDARRVA